MAGSWGGRVGQLFVPGAGPCLNESTCPQWGLEVEGAIGVRVTAEGAPQSQVLRFIRLAGRGGLVPDVRNGGRGRQ